MIVLMTVGVFPGYLNSGSIFADDNNHMSINYSITGTLGGMILTKAGLNKIDLGRVSSFTAGEGSNQYYMKTDFDSLRDLLPNLRKLVLQGGLVGNVFPANSFCGPWGSHKNIEEITIHDYGNDEKIYIGNSAFYGCTNLKEVNIYKGIDPFGTVIGIGHGAFGYTGIEEIGYNSFKDVENISYDAFKGCDSLKSINFPKLLTIDDYTFKDCDALKTITLPKLTTMGWGSFEYCDKLETVRLPKLTTVRQYGFYNCSNLKSIEIPNVKNIQQNAFKGCDELRYLTLGSVPPTVEPNAFDLIMGERYLKIPQSAFSAYDPDGDGKWHDWTLTTKSSECRMLSFSFNEFTPTRIGHIANTKWVWITVPYGTDMSKLTPTIEVSPLATVSPASGVAQDFRGTDSNNQGDLIHYTVRAEDSSITDHYYIHVSEEAGDKNDIVGFSFNNLTPSVEGNINESTNIIEVTVPHDTDITSLKPYINHSLGSTVTPKSEVFQDFTNPLEYTVTAADGSEKKYMVVVRKKNKLPTLQNDIENDISINVPPTESYKVNLLDIFKDDDRDVLLYYTSVNGSDFEKVDTNYSYKMTNTDLTQIIFKAHDGIDFSIDTYRVKLISKESNNVPEVIYGEELQMGTATPRSNDGNTAAQPYKADVSNWFKDRDEGDVLTYILKAATDINSHSVAGDISLNSVTGKLIYTPKKYQESLRVEIRVKAKDLQRESLADVTILVDVGEIPADGNKLPIAITMSPTDISAKEAVLNSFVNGNGFITTVMYEYGLDTNYGSTIVVDQSPVTGNLDTWINERIYNLIPDTTYHYRVVCENSEGITYGLDETFKTEKESVITNPIKISLEKLDVSTHGANDGSITVTASAYGEHITYEYNLDKGIGFKDENWQSSNHFTDLFAGTYKAKARDKYNKSNESNSKSITINEPPPPGTNIKINVKKTDVSTYGGNDGSITIIASEIKPKFKEKTVTSSVYGDKTVTGAVYGTKTVTQAVYYEDMDFEFNLDIGLGFKEDNWQSSNKYKKLQAGIYRAKARDKDNIKDESNIEVVKISEPSKPSSGGGGGGGGGGSYKPQKHPVDKAFEEAKKNLKCKLVGTIKLDNKNEKGEYVQDIPVKYFKDDNKLLKIETPVGTINIPCNMFKKLPKEKVELVIKKVEISQLPDHMKKEVNKYNMKRIIDIIMIIDGKKQKWVNENIEVEMFIPYGLSLNERNETHKIVAAYIDNNGVIKPLISSRYDLQKGGVRFKTNHFSNYAVVIIDKKFDDIDSYPWAIKSIKALAAKGVIKGISEHKFGPDLNMKRGDFIILITKLFNLRGEVVGNFRDVLKGSYYYDAVGIAKKAGIIWGGRDNNFNPLDKITRQDMMVILYNALKVTNNHVKITGHSGKIICDFDDVNDVSNYAKDSIDYLIKKGIVTGTNNRIYPRKKAKRAEVAVLLNKLLDILNK